MAYSNGLIYVDTSVTPNIGVSINDIQQCCWVRLKRTVSGSVQYKYSGDLGVLCGASVGDIIPASDGLGSWTVDSRGFINKWARYKPQRREGPMPMVHGTEGAPESGSRKAGNFGLEVPYCITNPNRGWVANVMNQMVWDILNGNYDAWAYLKPRGDRTAYGGVEEYFRLTDWVRILTDTTDPFYNTVYAKGYNHHAQLPFYAYINQTGLTIRHDFDGDYYEINLQETSSLTLTFYNNSGDDLHLQDFIVIQDYGSSRAWRPVLQVFNGYVPAGGDEWYEKSQPDVEVGGDAITDVAGSHWEVSLPLTGSNFTRFINDNESFHLCVGVGCVNPSFTSWKDSTTSLFVMPFTEQQYAEDDMLPFYYRFKLVEYMNRQLDVIQLMFLDSARVIWQVATGTAPYFIIHSNAAQQIRLTMTITKSAQAVDFININGEPASGYTALIIEADETITGGSSTPTTRYLTPANPNDNWGPTHYLIPAGNTDETVTIYATMYIDSNIPVGGYGQYHMKALSGGSQPSNIGFFSIKKIQYSNN